MRDRQESSVIEEYVRQTDPLVSGAKAMPWCDEPWRLDSKWQWWESRIRGLERTVESLQECAAGERKKHLVCQGCEHDWFVPWTCDITLLCPSCRAVLANKRAHQVRDQVTEAVAEHSQGEQLRMVTLPVPHAGQFEQRADVAFRAKRRFFRRFGEWVQGENPRKEPRNEERIETHNGPGDASPVAESRDTAWAASVAHWDALEVTAGDDGEGHVHWHSLVLSGFVPQPLLAMWWADAVARCGGEPFAGTVMWSSSLESLEWIRGHCMGRTRRNATRELLRFARLPWNVEGRRPPRRGEEGPVGLGARSEPLTLYVWRRVAWATRLAEAGETVRCRSLSRVLGDYRQRADELSQGELDMLADCCDVPRLVVDVRLADTGRDAFELAKYALKDADMPPKLQARAFIALRGRHLLQSTFSWTWKADDEGGGCPECACTDVRLEKDSSGIGDYQAVWAIVRRARADGRLGVLRRPPPTGPPLRKGWVQQNFGEWYAREA